MPSSVQVTMDIYKYYLYANLINTQGMTHLMEFTKCWQKSIEILISALPAIDLQTEDKK